MEKKYQSIAISCKAYEILDKLAALNPAHKKFMLVSELIENAYAEQMKNK